MKSRALFCIALVAATALAVGLRLGERSNDTAAADSLANAPIAQFQVELLQLAGEAASALPTNPHVKTKAKLQEAVAATCLELDQPRRAESIVETIENWRRGTGYADLAHHAATHGAPASAPRYLELARAVSESSEAAAVDGDVGQDWRNDRIRARIARAWLALGKPDEAAELAAGLAPSEAGAVSAARARRTEADEFERPLEELDAALAGGDFDSVRGALDACVRLYERFHADTARRARVEGKLRASWSRVPVMVRIELMLELGNAALRHSDLPGALTWESETRLLVESAEWNPEDEIPLLAKCAALRYRAGLRQEARRAIENARALYLARIDGIADIWRAAPLRALAEACETMDDRAQALDFYARAIEAGTSNPNSRPRAEDLCATCCSMALHAVDPGPELLPRLRSIRAALQPPW